MFFQVMQYEMWKCCPGRTGQGKNRGIWEVTTLHHFRSQMHIISRWGSIPLQRQVVSRLIISRDRLFAVVQEVDPGGVERRLSTASWGICRC